MEAADQHNNKPSSPSKPAPLQPTISPSNLSTPSKDQPPRSAGPYSHRHSMSQELRGIPTSPRHRQPSMSQQAIQELFNNPPLPHKGDSRFAGRDWKKIKVGEVVDPALVYFAEVDTSVEDATKLLIESGSPNVVLVREDTSTREVTSTFDFSDLNAYLLLVVGLAQPSQTHASSFNEVAKKGREGKTISLKEVKNLGQREAIITLSETADLTEAVELLGGGHHRIVVTKEGSKDALGVLTQLRLVHFFWENGRHFDSVEQCYPKCLVDLQVGSKTVRSINGDKPLSDALELMNTESITSLPVLDNQKNVVGNISHVDVRLLTKSTSLPLLRSSCIHFISVILSERGMEDGADSYPVFYVNPYSTLAHTVAKLTATRSHRMWIVDAPSPGSSTPATPGPIANPPPSMLLSGAPPNGPPFTQATSAVTASSLPGQHMSGRLSGVISLTDVLNLFARASGLSPQDPADARRQRRRSSSSSMRPSIDSARSSSVDLTRSGSTGGGTRR